MLEGGPCMREEVINLRDKRLEQSILGISTEIANAVEMAEKSKKLAANTEDILKQTQLELEELYLGLDKSD